MPNPYDLENYMVNVQALLELLAYRDCELRKITVFPNDHEKSFHDGMLAELRSVSELIKSNMYKTGGPPIPPVTPASNNTDANGEIE
jgi:hypothetical protein